MISWSALLILNGAVTFQVTTELRYNFRDHPTTSRRVKSSNECSMSHVLLIFHEPCVSIVNPKLLIIFSSLHDALEIASLINISTRNAVCVIIGRHLMVSEFTNPAPFQQEETCWSYKTTYLRAKYWSEMTFHKLSKQPK